jgi:hypothetical protein
LRFFFTRFSFVAGSCDFLQLLYDPRNKNGEGCSSDDRAKCKEGDLTGKFGKLRIGKEETMFTKNLLTDVDLELPELDNHRSLYLVLFDQDHPESFLACAKIRSTCHFQLLIQIIVVSVFKLSM